MRELYGQQISLIFGAILIAFALGIGAIYKATANTNSQVGDMIVIGQTIQQDYSNQNWQYGTGPIPSAVLTATGKVPPALISGSNILTRWGTPIALAALGTQFSATLTGASVGQCADIMNDGSLGALLASAQAGSGAQRTPPVQYPTAEADCASGAGQLTLTYNGHP